MKEGGVWRQRRSRVSPALGGGASEAPDRPEEPLLGGTRVLSCVDAPPSPPSPPPLDMTTLLRSEFLRCLTLLKLKKEELKQ